MPDSPADLDLDAFGRRFKEYQICRDEAARLESYIWLSAAVFGVASAAGLAFTLPLAGRVPPRHYARLAVAIVTAFEINASLLWWRFVRRWWSLQTLTYQHMYTLEAALGFRQRSLVSEADEQAMGIPRVRTDPRGRRHEYRGSLPAIQFFLGTNALLWSVVLLSEVFGEPHHRKGVEASRNYAIPFTPLATLRHLPLRLDPVMPVGVAPPGAVSLETVRTLPAPDTTLLELLGALFDEFTYYGSPEARDQELADLLREDEEPEEGGNITLQQLREELEARRRGSA